MEPYYEKDGQTIYLGDCREVLPTLDADVLVTDPPFGIGFASGQHGKFKGNQIQNDNDTRCRDEVLLAWGNRPALVFGRWDNPIIEARQVIVWDKGEGVGMGDLSIPWKPNWEMIFILGTGFVGNRTSGVIRDSSVVSWSSKGRLHPNMKPLGLLQKLIVKCPLGLILDPFMGSGTTLVAAKLLGRKAIGIEIEEKYCSIAAKRLEQKVFQWD